MRSAVESTKQENKRLHEGLAFPEQCPFDPLAASRPSCELTVGRALCPWRTPVRPAELCGQLGGSARRAVLVAVPPMSFPPAQSQVTHCSGRSWHLEHLKKLRGKSMKTRSSLQRRGRRIWRTNTCSGKIKDSCSEPRKVPVLSDLFVGIWIQVSSRSWPPRLIQTPVAGPTPPTQQVWGGLRSCVFTKFPGEASSGTALWGHPDD